MSRADFVMLSIRLGAESSARAEYAADQRSEDEQKFFHTLSRFAGAFV